MQPGTGYSFRASSSGTAFNAEKVWPEDIFPTGTHLVVEIYKPHPFRIMKVSAETAILAGWTFNLYPQRGDLYTVLPGTVNAIPIIFPGAEVCDEETTYIYVKTYPDAEMSFVLSVSPLSNSDSEAYILIGTVNINGVNQFVKSNIVRERYKLGQLDADYHHSYTDLI
jgi:hypothetical protein